MTMEKDELKAFVDAVAARLGEAQEGPVRQIELIAEHMGKEFLEATLAETVKIEEDGGMMTDDGKRRRTLGGIFFYLAKGKIDGQIRQIIFPGFGQKEKGRVVEWQDRHEFIKDLLSVEAAGEMRYVLVTLHGRPNQVAVEDNSVMMTIAHQHSPTPFPRGVPQPPDLMTMYTVYMSSKHWDAVKESLEKYKNDRLIVEGSLFFDQETNTIAVLAVNVTTKRMQKTARKEGETPAVSEAKPEKTAKHPPKGGAGKNNRNAPSNPKYQAKPTPPPMADIELPEGIPSDVALKLRQLHGAADTLRERISDMEAKGQAGVSMTKKLLQNTEKQIASLERQYIK